MSRSGRGRRVYRLMLLAIAIFVVTITMVIWQPRGLGTASAIGGALLALATGVISLADIPVVWDIIWNATGAFVAVILISLILDRAGVFEWAAPIWRGGARRRSLAIRARGIAARRCRNLRQ